MAKNYRQSSSLLSRCFRSNKTISTSETISKTDITSNTSPFSSVIEAIQTIDQVVQSTEGCSKNQQDDPHSMSIEQIEDMLIKWTHIAYFLVNTYQQKIDELN